MSNSNKNSSQSGGKNVGKGKGDTKSKSASNLYVSTGKLHVRSSRGEYGRALRVRFIPDEDHSVYHGGRTLAVFLQDAELGAIPPTDPTSNLGHVRLIAFEEANPVVLSVTADLEPGFLDDLRQAAVNQLGVDIGVNFPLPPADDQQLPELVAVTVPAITHRR